VVKNVQRSKTQLRYEYSSLIKTNKTKIKQQPVSYLRADTQSLVWCHYVICHNKEDPVPLLKIIDDIFLHKTFSTAN